MTLGLVYALVFFLFFSMLLIAPELRPLMELEPGPEQQALAREVARRAVSPRLPVALALAVASTGAGIHFGVLPGLRRPGSRGGARL